MKFLKNILSGLIRNERNKSNPTCDRCKTSIEVPDYVYVTGAIISRSKSPRIFICPEQAFNFGQGIKMHPTCWIDTLKDHNIPLYDLDKVYEEYKNNLKKGASQNGMGQNDTSK